MRRRQRNTSTGVLSIATAAVLLPVGTNHDVAVMAFAPSFGMSPSSSRQRSLTTIPKMAETSYPFHREGDYRSTSYLMGPLFHDVDSDWSSSASRRRSRTRGLLSTSSIIFSTKGRFSFLEESSLDNDDDREENLLDYLPLGREDDLSPKTRQLLQRVTSEYVNGAKSPTVSVEDVLDVLDADYKSRDVPVRVGDKTFDFASSGEVDDADVARILSFAAHYRLPRDVALVLFGPMEDDTNTNELNGGDSFASCRDALARGGWMDVEFPKGLAIRPKRKFVTSTRKRLMPMPRTWMTSRRDAVRRGQVAVSEAMYTQPPPRRLLSREEFLASMDEELSSSATEPIELLPSLFREARQFFPRQNLKLKRLRKVLKKQIALIKDAGLAGLISYVTLSFAWYTCAVVFGSRTLPLHQHHFPIVDLTSQALITAMRRFGKVLVAVFVGSQLTRVLRLKIALGLAPFANRALRFTQRKLSISETKAFAVLSGVVAGTCLALWSIVVLGDAALLKTASGAISFEQVGAIEPSVLMEPVIT